MPNPGLPMRFLKKNIDLLKKDRFEQKISGRLDTKLGASFHYVPYLGICQSQNVMVNYVTLLLNFCGGQN